MPPALAKGLKRQHKLLHSAGVLATFNSPYRRVWLGAGLLLHCPGPVPLSCPKREGYLPFQANRAAAFVHYLRHGGMLKASWCKTNILLLTLGSLG